MVLGCPVITTRCTSLPEVCGEAAYYIDPDNPESIARSLVDFETDPELRSRYSAKGKAQSAKFTWERAATTFLTALDRTLGERKASSG